MAKYFLGLALISVILPILLVVNQFCLIEIKVDLVTSTVSGTTKRSLFLPALTPSCWEKPLALEK